MSPGQGMWPPSPSPMAPTPGISFRSGLVVRAYFTDGSSESFSVHDLDDVGALLNELGYHMGEHDLDLAAIVIVPEED